ncbi:MAG: hypothetical protein ABSH32_22750 [Bryobacteraceae bacterium]
MRNRFAAQRLLSLAAFICLASSGFAQGTVDMTLTSAGNNILGPAYVGPYYATVGSETNVAIICDDFADESYVGQNWTADVFNVANLGAGGQTWMETKGVTLQDYSEAAWLAEQLVDPTSITCLSGADCAGDIQYAIWQLFDPQGNPLQYLSGNDLTTASNALTQATTLAANMPLSDFSNVTVYSPVGGGPPQEFLSVTTPEPSFLALFGVDLPVLLIAVFLIRRHRAGATR